MPQSDKLLLNNLNFKISKHGLIPKHRQWPVQTTSVKETGGRKSVCPQEVSWKSLWYLLNAWSVDHLQRLVDFQKRTKTCKSQSEWAIKSMCVQTNTLLFFLWHCKTLSVHYLRLNITITALQAIKPTYVWGKLTSTSLEVWQWGNEDLVKEQRAAIHFDGTW